MIHGDVTPQDAPSYGTAEDIERSLLIATQAMGERGYRAPWSSETEMRQFRAELQSAIKARPQGFDLRGRVATSAPRRPPFGSRLRALFSRS